MIAQTNQRIDGKRLWDSLMAMAQIGATPKGGVRRLTLTEVDRRGRDRFRAECEAAGLTVRVDAIGNMFARRPGRDPNRLPVLFGSHLDSQPSGGKFDGALGVLAGLEVMHTLNDLGIVTEAPLELVNWTDEEGSRFGHSLMGSGVWSGVFPLDKAYALTDVEGVTVRTALDGIGYRGPEPAAAFPADAYFELHIEQGPILERETKADRHRHRRAGDGLVRRGRHRPGFPRRHHAALGAQGRAGLRGADHRPGRSHDARARRGRPRHGRATAGLAEQPQRGAGRGAVLGGVPPPVRCRGGPSGRAVPARGGLHRPGLRGEAGADAVVQHPGAAVRSRLRGAGAAGRGEARLQRAEIVSGAGHDAVYVARHVPTAMIFTPCKDGLSHNEAESIEPEEAEAGAQVLFEAVLARANRQSDGSAGAPLA